MKNNNCALIHLMGICTLEDESCEYFNAGDMRKQNDYPSCIYFMDGKCCHALAILASTMRDSKSSWELKHLLNGL